MMELSASLATCLFDKSLYGVLFIKLLYAWFLFFCLKLKVDIGPNNMAKTATAAEVQDSLSLLNGTY